MSANNFFRCMGRWISPLSLAVILAGCFFSGEDKVEDNGPGLIVVGSTVCADLNPTQQRQGDSIVAIAAGLQGDELLYLFDTAGGNWDSMKTIDPQPVLNFYNQALQVAPGHCGALFGRAVANAMLIVKDPRLDAFIARLDLDPQVRGIGSLFKVSPDRAPPVLLKTSESMRAMDRTTIAEFQDLVENSVLTRLDTVLADLEQVLRYQNFIFTYRFITFDPFMGIVDTTTAIFDHVVLGPALGALKVGKSALLMVAGYDWEIAWNAGSYAYDWIDTMDNIGDADFDNLSPGKTAALNHVTSLFRTTSPFSRLKPAFAAKIPQIPSLLISAADNVQDGLRYGVQMAVTPLPNRAYRLLSIGSTVEDDLDPADANDMIALMDSVKSYMSGEKLIRYNRDGRTLRVNFSRVFSWNGLQNFLPYFTINPYAEWNDTLGSSADTVWTYFNPNYYLFDLALNSLGYSPDDYELWNYSYFDTATNTLFYQAQDTLGNVTTLATVTLDPVPCRIQYQRTYARVPDAVDPFTFYSVPNAASGLVMLPGCRDNGGYAEIVAFIDSSSRIKGPLYFTDAAGNRTAGFEDLDSINDPRDLAGKLILRDATFGGVFPGLTNANIWETIASLDSIEQRAEVCTPDPIYPWMSNCVWLKPTNPSTLDLFLWSMHRLDQYSSPIPVLKAAVR